MNFYSNGSYLLSRNSDCRGMHYCHYFREIFLKFLKSRNSFLKKKSFSFTVSMYFFFLLSTRLKENDLKNLGIILCCLLLLTQFLILTFETKSKIKDSGARESTEKVRLFIRT